MSDISEQVQKDMGSRLWEVRVPIKKDESDLPPGDTTVFIL